MKKTIFIIISAALIHSANAVGTDSSNRTITTTGHGEVEIPQKIALISLTINETAKKPQDAQEQARQKFERVLTAIKQVQTLAIYSSMVSVTPNWSYADNQSKITGYTANYSIQVKSSISNSGTIIDKAVANGASIIGNPQLSATDKEKADAELQAIKLATNDARTKTEASLSALGLKAKAIRQITIQDENQPRPPLAMPRMAVMKASADNSAPATEIMAGMDTVSADVVLVTDY